MGTHRFLFLLALGPLAPAQSSPSGATVTVTAEAAPVDVARTPNPVRIIEADELERLQARTVADLLQAILPGSVMGTGGYGKQTSAFLNGTLSRNVVILVDGVRLNDPTDVTPNLGSLGLAGIERVELLLGPSSVLYGSDAIGGVIHLRTAKGAGQGCHGTAGLRAGTQGQAAAWATARMGWQDAWITAGGEASRQGSDFPGDALRQAGGFLRGGWHREGLDLTASYRNSGQTATQPFDTPAPAYVRAYLSDREGRARGEQWGLELRWQLAPALLLENTASGLSGSTGDPAGQGRLQTDRRYRRAEDLLTLHWTPSAALRLSGRLEGRVDHSDAQNFYDPATYAQILYRGEGRDLAQALEVHWTVAPELDWVSGLRHEAAHRDTTQVAAGLRIRVGTAEATTLKTGLNWLLTPAWRLYGGFAQGFRMPNLTEFTYNALASAVDGTTYPLRPERSRTVQLGLNGRWDGGWEVRLTAQRTRLVNLLGYVYDAQNWPPAFTTHYANTGAVRAQSVEAALGRRGGQDLVWGWDVILRSAETRDLDQNVEGKRFGQANGALLRHPFFTGSLVLFAQQGAWRGDLRYDHIGPRYDLNDVTYAVLSTGHPFRELNASLAWTPTPAWTFTLRGEHLLQPKQNVQDWLSGALDRNGDAQLVYGFPAPGRRVSLAAAFRW